MTEIATSPQAAPTTAPPSEAELREQLAAELTAQAGGGSGHRAATPFDDEFDGHRGGGLPHHRRGTVEPDALRSSRSGESGTRYTGSQLRAAAAAAAAGVVLRQQQQQLE